jgi:hypothetical protein
VLNGDVHLSRNYEVAGQFRCDLGGEGWAVFDCIAVGERAQYFLP